MFLILYRLLLDNAAIYENLLLQLLFSGFIMSTVHIWTYSFFWKALLIAHHSFKKNRSGIAIL